MKIPLPPLVAVVALAGVAAAAAADTMDGHTIVAPQDIEWGPAPAVLPPGAEAAVLFGDPSKAQALPAGGFFALSPGMPHYVFIDEETVIQISTVGPWGLTYVNPEDDPRPKSQ